ncbi:MAG: CaiB/BaiF CoA transferase family protein [Halodesulfurarchaeum sp.]
MVGEAKTATGESPPLSDVTVLDASRVLAGPFCTMQLGDLGADVIKVERPGTGDQTRGWTPPTYGDSDVSSYYLSINRNKRSITLNLKSEGGREIFRDLASEADVLVENFRVGTMEDWGIGYEDLRQENPGLIYAKISGYGEWGPHRDRPAYDIVLQAEGGMMSITGPEDGPPVRVGVAEADLAAGMYATQGILASLLDRELGDGTGQKIDVSLLDGQVAWMSYMAESYLATGESPGRMGSKHPNIVPYQAFETADGYVVVAVASQHMWPRFCTAIGREDLEDDDRFQTNEDRVNNRDELDRILMDEFQHRNSASVVETLREHDVPASEVNDMEALFEHPQVLARNMSQSIDHPSAGDVDIPGSPMHLSESPTVFDRHPPELGEHTEEILSEYGYSESDISSFEESGAI